MQRNNGFTLIETLVGLTILAVLAVGAYTVWQRPAGKGSPTTPTATPTESSPISATEPTTVLKSTTTPTTPSPTANTQNKIAFVRNGDIWIADQDGTNQQIVVDNPGLGYQPHTQLFVSPNGKALAYVSYTDESAETSNQSSGGWPGSGPRTGQIRIVNLQTKNQISPDIPKAYLNAKLAWTPDSQKIVFLGSAEKYFALYSYDYLKDNLTTLDRGSEEHSLFSFQFTLAHPEITVRDSDVYYGATDFSFDEPVARMFNLIYQVNLDSPNPIYFFAVEDKKGTPKEIRNQTLGQYQPFAFDVSASGQEIYFAQTKTQGTTNNYTNSARLMRIDRKHENQQVDTLKTFIHQNMSSAAAVKSIRISPDQKWLLLQYSPGGRIENTQLINLMANSVIDLSTTLGATPHTLSWSSDSNTILSAFSRDGQAVVYRYSLVENTFQKILNDARLPVSVKLVQTK